MIDLLYKVNWDLTNLRVYPGLRGMLQALRKETTLSREGWLSLRDEKLREMVRFASEHVSYYKNLIQNAGVDVEHPNITQEIEKLPLLTKAIVQDRSDELLSDSGGPARRIENATGGSTGVPLKFYQDADYQTMSIALDAFVREGWGINPYEKTAAVWGADIDFPDQSWRERFAVWRLGRRSINAFRMTDESLLEFCRMLSEWRPRYLVGYSSALEALARCARRHAIDDLRFAAIRSSAEMLWPHQREIIETALNSPVYNFYGSREVNSIAAECPEEHRLHMISTQRFVEIVDGDGRRKPDGETGYIAVTDLTNRAMPFVRYRNEDVGRIAKDMCACGRPTPVLEELLGRSTDLIRLAGGDIIHGEYFTHLFYGRDDIRTFQVHQTDMDNIVVRIVSDAGVSAEFTNELEAKIRKKVGVGVKIRFEACDEIPVPASGKHRFTISDVTESDVEIFQT